MSTIRRARPEDAVPLTDLHLDCWDDAYTGLVHQPVIDARRAERTERIARWSTYVEQVPTWVAEDTGGLVGFACAGPLDASAPCLPDLHLWSLYTRARAWGLGLGRDLLTTALGDAPAWLWVLQGNDRAIGFYRRHGFALDGTAEDSVEGVDLRMVRW